MNTDPSMKNLLCQYLSGVPNMFYPSIELKIINLNPVQVTDSYLDLVDLSNLADEILDKVGRRAHRNYKVTLKKWNFVFNRVTNSNEFYFDIEAQKIK